MYQPVFLSALFLHTNTDCSHSFQCWHFGIGLKSLSKKSSTVSNHNIHLISSLNYLFCVRHFVVLLYLSLLLTTSVWFCSVLALSSLVTSSLFCAVPLCSVLKKSAVFYHNRVSRLLFCSIPLWYRLRVVYWVTVYDICSGLFSTCLKRINDYSSVTLSPRELKCTEVDWIVLDRTPLHPTPLHTTQSRCVE